MRQNDRPTLLDAFLSLDKRPEVYFYTSNDWKFIQANIVFQRYGLPLHYFHHTSEPYHEDYDKGTHELLKRAIEEIKAKVGQLSIFFVEDTSLRIDALSVGNTDFPGLAVKEWFPQTTFEDLDRELIQRGKGRKAVVKSDIALHVPGMPRPLFFHAETKGRVADTPPCFQETTQYPWLTDKSFNGWFIPDGASKRLGEMTLEESWNFDFRILALTELIKRLEEYAIVLNLPTRCYSRVRQVQDNGEKPHSQLALLTIAGPKLIVVGRT